MSDKDREKTILTEHVLEVRHEASGTFLMCGDTSQITFKRK